MTKTLNARSSLRAFFRASTIILATTVVADAATITVNSFNQVDPGQCTIATAIASINAAADQPGCTHAGTYGTADTIVLAAGTYASTVIDNSTNAYPLIQKALTITGNGATLSRTVGAVAPFFRFFQVAAGSLTLNNATLAGGNLPNGNGGAIFSDSGPLVVSGSTSPTTAPTTVTAAPSITTPSRPRASATRPSPTIRFREATAAQFTTTPATA